MNSKIVNIDSFYYNSNFSYKKTNIPGLTLFKWKKAKFGGSRVEGFCRIVCTAVDTDVVDDDDDCYESAFWFVVLLVYITAVTGIDCRSMGSRGHPSFPVEVEGCFYPTSSLHKI